MDLEHAKQEFQKYVETFDLENDAIMRKWKHSYQVMKISKEIALRRGFSKKDIELAELIGLLHDIGRFYQMEKTQSFNDQKLDHSDYGVMYLFEENHIRDFIKDDQYDEIIRKSILYHNDFALPKREIDALTEQEERFCKLIRDADKIDIYRVYVECFKYSWSKEKVTPSVLEDFQNRKCIRTQDKKTKSDVVMLILAFLYDINFPESFDILKEEGYFAEFTNQVEVDEDSKEEWKRLTRFCKKMIESRDKYVREEI